MSTVFRTAVTDYAQILEPLRRTLDLLGTTAPLLARDEPLLIKPNLLGPYPPEAAVTTHPALVEAAIQLAKEGGAKPWVADSPGFFSARRAAQVAGVAAVCRRHGVPLVDLGQGAQRLVHGATFRSLPVAEQALECRWIWNLPKWKTHTMMGLTLGVKNLYGCVPGKRKVAAHFRTGRDADAFACQLLDLEQLLQPTVTILDGVVAMDGPGPAKGTPLRRHLLLAATDTCALDWEATRLSGFAPEDVPTVQQSLRSGRLDPATVHVRGDAAEPLPFCAAPGSPCDWPLPRPLKHLLRGALSPLPRLDADLCTGCGICVEACPGQALQRGRPPQLSPATCIRCYCCQELCPAGAARVPARSAKTLLADFWSGGVGS